MDRLANTVCIETCDVEPAWEEAFNSWYREDVLPRLRQLPGYVDARAYVAVDGGPKYMVLSEIESPEAYYQPARDRIADTDRARRITPHVQSRIASYRQIFPAEGLLRGVSWGDGKTAIGGLLVSRVDVDPAQEQDFNDWFNLEHLPALCTVPGSIGARRLEVIEGEPKYMSINYLVDPAVQASEPWKEATNTPWTARVRSAFRGRLRVVYRPVP